jgi:hypothetical protein
MVAWMLRKVEYIVPLSRNESRDKCMFILDAVYCVPRSSCGVYTVSNEKCFFIKPETGLRGLEGSGSLRLPDF